MGISARFRAFRKRKKDKKKKREFQTQFQAALGAEAAATNAGAEAFQVCLKTFEKSSPLLRRNIHRLEKGLCMPERRELFASDFILETVYLFARLSEQSDADPSEKQWAHDVLKRYFAVVDTTDLRVAEAHNNWKNIPPFNVCKVEYAPYSVADLSNMLDLENNKVPSFIAFKTLCKARRSQRWFKDEPIPPEKLEAAVSAALQAPSACNRQPFKFYCAQSNKTIAKISALPLGTSGFGESLPCLIAVVGDLSAFSHPRDRHLIFIDAALASMQLMLGLTALGLGSVPINWPDLPENHEELRGVLGLKEYQVPIMLIGAGIPKDDCQIPFSAKRPVSEVLQFVD